MRKFLLASTMLITPSAFAAGGGIEIHTGMVAGRIVWGNPGVPQHKTQKDQATGANVKVMKDGQPVNQWAFGVAFDKTHFHTNIWPYMEQESRVGYPNGVPGNFSWKYKDGDTVDNQGKPYSDREGYAGCYVLTVSTEAFAPPIYQLVNGAYVQLQPNQIKCGDYVAMSLNIKVNVPSNRTHTPGLYINPVAIELVGVGTEIVSTGSVDPNAALGGRTGIALPPGVSLTPPVGSAAPGGPMMPGGMPTMPATPGAPPALPPMGGQPSAPPQLPPPAANFIPGAPPAPGAAAMPAPPPPPPPAAPAGPQRPTEPTHIHLAGQPGEMWFINGAWTPAPVAGQPGFMPPR